MEVTKQYEDIFQNIEAVIISIYRNDDELTDYQVDKAIAALIRNYQAEQRKRTPPQPNLSPEIVQRLYDNVQTVCEFRLGRGSLTPEMDGLEVNPVSLDIMIAILKRLRKSIATWTEYGGRQGYLQFIDPFLI